MSKSLREGFVCWLHEFYSAGKYINLIAFQMVRIWINEQVVLWIEELMKTSFLWVCILCSSISYTSAVPSSTVPMTPPYHIPPTHLLQLQLLPLSLLACTCWLAGVRLSWVASQHAMEHVTAGFTPSWPSLLLLYSSPSPRSLAGTSEIWRPVPV